MAHIKDASSGVHGSYGQHRGQQQNARQPGGYVRSLENRNYLKQHMTPAQLRMDAAQMSQRSGPSSHASNMNSLPPAGPPSRLHNQYSANLVQPLQAQSNYRNQY